MPAASNVRDLPAVSGITLRLFRRVVRAYFRRHFRSVMVQYGERLAVEQGPLIVFANHSSWWDPMVSVLLAQLLLPNRRHYAPMDAAALKRYPILGKIGIFPVERASARGAAQFLRASQAILESGGVLWITPQGRFADPREQTLGFKPGLGALAARTPGVVLLPLAIEYAFWNERLPETLLRVGEPVRLGDGASAEDATQVLERALAETMEKLKQASMARDTSAFCELVCGGRGTGGIYGWGRRLRARFVRQSGVQDHTERHAGSSFKDDR
ncbi:MAG: lysophospholipid acyltransferase family protein [Acidobacteriaceae bacterium]